MREDAAVNGILGDTAVWGSVGYTGDAFAPVRGTYLALGGSPFAYTTEQDSGAHARSGNELGNLHPLIAAAMYEAAFAFELGPLSTWSN